MQIVNRFIALTSRKKSSWSLTAVLSLSSIVFVQKDVVSSAWIDRQL